MQLEDGSRMRFFTRRRALVLAGLLIAGYLGWSQFFSGTDGDGYDYAFVTKGTVERTVSASGTLRPGRLIEIGAEVSGKILALDADHNDPVTKGQRLALIDGSAIEEKIVALEAQLARVRGMRLQAEAEEISAAAELREAKRELERTRSLLDGGVLSPQALDPVETRVALAEAAVLRARSSLKINDADIANAESALRQARVDLARTVISAPVDGVVLRRAVEVGQTLTAGFSTPLLYEIAAADGGLVLEARIDEADIGGIREGQAVRFSVDAFPDREFTGSVKAVYRAPVLSDGITSYPVIIAVNDAGDTLYSGMTALVRIAIERLEDAVRVPNRAFSFDPDSAEAESEGSVSIRLVSREEAERLKRANATRERLKSGDAATGSVVWKVDSTGHDDLVPIEVVPLLRGDSFSAVDHPELRPGDRIAIGLRSGSDAR